MADIRTRLVNYVKTLNWLAFKVAAGLSKNATRVGVILVSIIIAVWLAYSRVWLVWQQEGVLPPGVDETATELKVRELNQLVEAGGKRLRLMPPDYAPYAKLFVTTIVATPPAGEIPGD